MFSEGGNGLLTERGKGGAALLFWVKGFAVMLEVYIPGKYNLY